jgi:hypothetical protein
MRIYDGAHARVKGHAAQVFEPSHTYTFEAAVKRTGEAFPWFVD